MRIRPASGADAARISAIHAQSVEAGDCTMAEAWPSAELERFLIDLPAGETLLVLEEEGQIWGWGQVRRYSPRPGYRSTCETSIFLDRGRLGRGLGRPLQQALLDACRSSGYHHVVAKIWASNRSSIRFHESFGFTLVGVQREVGWVAGLWRDVAILQLILA